MEAEKALERITPEEAGISSRQVKKCIEELMHETTHPKRLKFKSCFFYYPAL